MLILNDTLFKISDRFTVGPINVEVAQGKHVAIIGESGCGKTTLLKMIYGLFDIDQGEMLWKIQQITGPEENLIPGMPFAKYLSQDFELMPFTSVAENIHKYLSRLQPELSKKRTEELMEVVEMSAYAKTKVKTLSGGQKQRVALAQTLAKEPELLLLDEPFSHIDNFRKNKLRRRLFAYLKKQNITCLVATHDCTDVLSFMDETIVMKEGKIITKGVTKAVYNSPSSLYIGSLFGDLNEIPRSWFYPNAKADQTILVYPHQISASTSGLEFTVVSSYFMGSHYLVRAVKSNKEILFNTDQAYTAGKTLHLSLNRPR